MNFKSPCVIFLVGLPASGKSTFVSSLHLENSVIASSDNIIDSYAKSKNSSYNKVFHEYVKIADEEFRKIFSGALNKNKNIIVDRTNLTHKARKNLLNQVPSNYTKYAVVFTVDENERVRRMKQRAELEDKSIPANVIDIMKKSYIRPSFEEGFDEIYDY